MPLRLLIQRLTTSIANSGSLVGRRALGGSCAMGDPAVHRLATSHRRGLRRAHPRQGPHSQGFMLLPKLWLWHCTPELAAKNKIGCGNSDDC